MLEHTGDVDTRTDHYQITSIDRKTGIILVNFAWHGHGLHHMIAIEDVEDSEGMLKAIEEHYGRYKADVEKAHAHEMPLPDTVRALIGQKHAR